MKSQMELSKKSQRFLDDLRTYLFTQRKNLNDVDEITNDLQEHLLEAERNGKSIEKIIGKSPKEYMNIVSSELPTDNKNWFKYFLVILFGSLTFAILPDLMDLNLSFSVLEIGSYIVVSAVFIFLAFMGFKYTSTMEQSASKQALVLFAIVVLMSILTFSLIYLDRVIDSPIIHLGTIGSLIVAVPIIIFLIGLIIWATK
ncbi:DUF1129 family protein [Metaplanococcus flavidus]|uniref:DUF1129 family protein n=1 Tax=Metaplanococcus flavidus TaxID=569883 RepID=A0ABW3LAS9_9BACL